MRRELGGHHCFNLDFHEPRRVKERSDHDHGRRGLRVAEQFPVGTTDVIRIGCVCDEHACSDDILYAATEAFDSLLGDLATPVHLSVCAVDEGLTRIGHRCSPCNVDDTASTNGSGESVLGFEGRYPVEVAAIHCARF